MLGCGARSGLPDPDGAAERDAATDSAADVRVDTAIDVFRPPSTCTAAEGAGVFAGQIVGTPINFPFVVAGVEPAGTHSCPRLFIRAGDDPTFSGSTLEIEVPISERPPRPGSGWGR
jgi:hypothetical protein